MVGLFNASEIVAEVAGVDEGLGDGFIIDIDLTKDGRLSRFSGRMVDDRLDCSGDVGSILVRGLVD